MTSQAERSVERELLSLLKVENNGWNITLFSDAKKMSVCLCASCGFVCCGAVELDCDHKEDEDIFVYCKQCLIRLIAENEDKCIINSHINPQIVANRAIRRHVLKSLVICPYSQQYKMRNMMQQNDNRQIMDTLMMKKNNNITDEEEGNQTIQTNGNDSDCEWKGKLTDLINKHILQCAATKCTNNPTFTLNVKVKKLQQENIKLKHELNARKQEILRNENVIRDMKSDKMVKIRNENEGLRKELAAEKKASVDMSVVWLSMGEEYERRLAELMNAFAAKEKAAIETQKNLKNIQKKQANEIKKLKKIIAAKESEIKEEKKETVLNAINIFKGNNHCIVDVKNSIFTTKGAVSDKRTYGILGIPWSKDTNGGVHEFKLQCLQSAVNAISIGLVTNRKAKTGKWLFDAYECGVSYQLYVGPYTAIEHYKFGKQEYEQKPRKRKAICDEWMGNSYEPNETMSLRVDFNKLELSFFINSKKMGKTIKIKSNTYYPAVAYHVWNGYFRELGVLQIKVLSLE